MRVPQRVSIELTHRCGKRCAFCYNHSHPEGETWWTPQSVATFALDCCANGTEALSFGGGEPLEFAGWQQVLAATRGRVFRSLTTNGLPLNDAATFADLVDARPEKVHVSIHFPQNAAEVNRVVRQVTELRDAGLRAGVNLLVRRSQLAETAQCAATLHEVGIGNDAIVYLPVRGLGVDTPTAKEIATVANGPFQSMTCLPGCGRSERFCSVGWDGQVGWCSYTTARRRLREPTAAALAEALDGLGLVYCGEESDEPRRIQLTIAR